MAICNKDGLMIKTNKDTYTFKKGGYINEDIFKNEYPKEIGAMKLEKYINAGYLKIEKKKEVKKNEEAIN